MTENTPTPDEPNAGIELHDSVLEAIEKRHESLTIQLRAYVHRSTGRPGIDSGTGWYQTAAITLLNGQFVTSPVELPATIGEGLLQIGTRTLDNIIPCPLKDEGVTLIDLNTTNGERLQISADALAVAFDGEPKFSEYFR